MNILHATHCYLVFRNILHSTHFYDSGSLSGHLLSWSFNESCIQTVIQSLWRHSLEVRHFISALLSKDQSPGNHIIERSVDDEQNCPQKYVDLSMWNAAMYIVNNLTLICQRFHAVIYIYIPLFINGTFWPPAKGCIEQIRDLVLSEF